MHYTVAVFFGLAFATSASEQLSTTSKECDANAHCVGYYEGFNCSCNRGFKGSVGVCVNIDECNETPEVCAEAETCHDKFGSYNCTCGDINIECHKAALCISVTDRPTCVCIQGYTGNGVNCTDIDECLMRTDNCSEDALCKNSVGSFACTCYDGFKGNGFMCADIDECALGTDKCDLPLTCSNTKGSYDCLCGNDGICDNNAYCNEVGNTTSCFCNIGFEGSGVECVDINECSASNNCHDDAECQNNPGSYRCICKPGFAGDGKECSGANPLSVSTTLIVVLLASFLLSFD